MPLLRDVAAARAWPLYAAAVLFAAACGGNEFVYNPDAAGSPGDDAGGGADAGADTGGATAFCDALTAYFAHCQFNLPCDKRNLDNCGAFSYALSDVARSAFISCEESMSIQCARGGQAWVRESCVSAKLAAGTQTMAQSKLATDYCNACPQTATGVTCTPHTFFQQNPVSAALDGPGFDALLYNDTLVKSVDQMCTNARTCEAFFRICEGVYIQSQAPQDACGDGG